MLKHCALALALFAAPYLMPLPALAQPLVWLWTLAGIVIGKFSAPLWIVAPLYYLGLKLAGAARHAAQVRLEPRLVEFQLLLLAIAISMVLSLWQNRQRH